MKFRKKNALLPCKSFATLMQFVQVLDVPTVFFKNKFLDTRWTKLFKTRLSSSRSVTNFWLFQTLSIDAEWFILLRIAEKSNFQDILFM